MKALQLIVTGSLMVAAAANSAPATMTTIPAFVVVAEDAHILKAGATAWTAV